MAESIKKALGLDKGSGVPQRDKVGKLTTDQVKKIAEEKMDDLNAKNIESASKIVAGKDKSTGGEVENGESKSKKT